jgi:2-polyprenyl-6-methoxyphenol hydroxylase-like FAD-dependent oxidoreductase
MATPDKVIVAGGGVGGLALALMLRRAGAEVEVHERHDGLQGRATGFTVWSYAIKRLLDAGLERERLDSIASELEATEIRTQEGEELMTLPVGEVSEKLGAPTCDVNRARLQQVLIDAVGTERVHFGSEVVDVEQDGDRATAVLAGGEPAVGDLVVGADGIHSTLRTKLVGERKLNYSGFAGGSGISRFTHDKLPARHHVELYGRDLKAGLGDVGDGHARWYMVYRAPAGSPPKSKAELLELARDWYEPFQAAIEAANEDDIVTSEAWDLDPIPTWHEGRVVLLGDAAHATTPFAAMGACMAIEDAAVLAERLGSESGVETALSAYEDERKKKAEDVVKSSRRMQHLATLHSPILAWVRNEAFQHVPPEKLEEIAGQPAAGD